MASIWSVRLGTRYTLQQLIDEVQVITGQLDTELVPRKSIAEHLNLSVLEVVSLLNTLCAPFYGVEILLSSANHGFSLDVYTDPNVIPATPQYNFALTVNDESNPFSLSRSIEVLSNSNGYYSNSGGILNVDYFHPYIERIVALRNNRAGGGTVKQARDISQFWGLSLGGNTQWSNSSAWLHFGNKLYLWLGEKLAQSNKPNDELNPPIIGLQFYVYAYRQAIPMDIEHEATSKLDLPDKYASLVVNKACLAVMKQAKMGEYQEVEGTVNSQIQQLTAEYDKDLALAMSRSKMEAIERS